MANQPQITSTFKFDWSIDDKIWNAWIESSSKDAIQSKLFGPERFDSTKFQLKLTYSSALKEYKLILVLVSCDDSEGGLEVKCEKFQRNETNINLVNHGYTRLEVGSRCEIWKSGIAFDLSGSFFEKSHFEFECKFSHLTNSQTLTIQQKEAQNFATNSTDKPDEKRHNQGSPAVSAFQQMQTIDHLHKTLLETRKDLQDFIAQANKKIGDLTQKNEESNTKIVEADTKIGDLIQKNEECNTKIVEAETKIGNLIQKNEECNTKIAETNAKISEANTRISNLTQNPVPIGFIYVQLSSQPEPRTLWPTLTWADVTSVYAGLFFRAEGGGAATFGTIQLENAPRVTKVCLVYYAQPQAWGQTDLNLGGVSSGVGVFTGNYNGKEGFTHEFHQSGGEVRPRNSAIRIWKRTN